MQIIAQLLKCNLCIYCVACVPSNPTYFKRIHLNLNTKIKCIIDTGPKHSKSSVQLNIAVTITRYNFFFQLHEVCNRKKRGALYISIKNPVYGLKTVYCSISTNTHVQCNKQAAISIQGT